MNITKKIIQHSLSASAKTKQSSINNLIGNILFGGFCTFIMIFFFMNDFKTPFLVGLVIPISLIITFLCFYLLKISFNIVSLAGLVLGIGEIIDSAIIVIENIEQSREEGNDLETACITGTQEVIRPLFTSILTNSAVFLPLIFVSGIAGALFYDQAIAVTLSLGISLLCSYTLIPVLYRLFYAKQTHFQPKITFVSRISEEAYDWLFDKIFKYKKRFFLFFILLAMLFVPLFWLIQKQGMPTISHTELEVKIDWNEAITVEENQRRLTEVSKSIQTEFSYKSSFIGQQQFILNRDLQQNYNECLLSIKVKSNNDFEKLKTEINQFLRIKYPVALTEIRATKNIFEQLFKTSESSLRANFTSNNELEVPDVASINKIYSSLSINHRPTLRPAQQSRIYIKIDQEKLLLYDVRNEVVYQKLKTIFNENIVGDLKSEQKYIPIIISDSEQFQNFEKLTNAMVKTNQGNYISLTELIEKSSHEDYKSYFQGKEGSFVPLNFDSDVVEIQNEVKKIISKNNELSVYFTGSVFKNQALIKELIFILLIAVVLLYFILTAQFESLSQPLIVILTIIFGLTGALFLLWIMNSSLNIMSVIGMVVLIGILDNDSILKIDTMNRSIQKMSLEEAIKSSGKKRLKSQLMTFLTTILGLLPVLFSTGLGAELQKPLAISVIGGMFLGLFISLTFIPLIYWYKGK